MSEPNIASQACALLVSLGYEWTFSDGWEMTPARVSSLREQTGQLIYDFDNTMINALAASRVGAKVALPSRFELVDALMNLMGSSK